MQIQQKLRCMENSEDPDQSASEDLEQTYLQGS